MPYIGLNSSYVPSAAEKSYMDHPGAQMGPRLLAAVFTWLLLGVLLCQTVNYFTVFKRDRWIIKAHVILIVIGNLLFDISIFMQCWHHYIMNFGDWISASTPPWFQKVVPVTGTTLDVLTQAFFVMRAFKLSHRNYIFLFLAVSCLIISWSGSVFEYVILIVGTTGRGLFVGIDGDKLNKGVELNLGGAMAADAIITGTTAYYLLTSRSGFKSTDHLIFKLLRISWMSALPPLVFQICNLAYHRRSATTLLTVFFNMCIPQLYAVSMMYTLNIRAELRQVTTSSEATPTQPSGSSKPPHSILRILRKDDLKTQEYALSTRPQSSSNIRVDTETYTDHGSATPHEGAQNSTFGFIASNHKGTILVGDEEDDGSVRSKRPPL